MGRGKKNKQYVIVARPQASIMRFLLILCGDLLAIIASPLSEAEIELQRSTVLSCAFPSLETPVETKYCLESTDRAYS